ncbi:hypothetical protein TSUD_145350 [Trifolium subterraneum]|uniref:Uncharacterized protein n=1 Tax=Trifolium subterraneum TaxID=3900 RepID=A0A2Z6MFY0_TRISU|nr:hypothetical protein TSUD_145350 [Trifolium subterraneum]
MPVITGHMKWRRPRNKLRHPNSETDKSSELSSIIQSTSCKSTITTLFSNFSNNTSNETTHDSNRNRTQKNNNKNINNGNFSAATFRGLGCTAGTSQQVSVPAVIRSSEDWQGKKNRKKKHRKKSNKTCHGVDDVDFQDVWCGPGIGFSSDATADVSADCVVARKNVSSRGKFDTGERVTHREIEIQV